jgi:hypothetical protein
VKRGRQQALQWKKGRWSEARMTRAGQRALQWQAGHWSGERQG